MNGMDTCVTYNSHKKAQESTKNIEAQASCGFCGFLWQDSIHG
jgi:hypothetical protein